MNPGSLQNTGFCHKIYKVDIRRTGFRHKIYKVDFRRIGFRHIKYKSTLVAPAFATLRYADLGHANFSIHCILCTLWIYSLLILHHTFYISETWGLDQPSIGTEHVYCLFRGIGELDDIHRLLSENSAYICKTAHVYCLFRGIGELDDIHRLLSENSAYIWISPLRLKSWPV